jgi:2-oxoglutarate ferredoxin oxidoreductase subunit beta
MAEDLHPIIKSIGKAIEDKDIKKEKVCLVTDVAFSQNIIEYLRVDTFHTTRGRTIAFGTGLKLGNPSLKVIVLMGDLATLGGNHFIQAGRRNMEMTVICINNFIYKKFINKVDKKISSFSLYGVAEFPFNIPHLAKSSGAVYVARWTTYHKEELTDSISKGLKKRGFSVIEVLSPGINYYEGIEEPKTGDEEVRAYYNNSIIKNNEDTRNLNIGDGDQIIVGEFVDKERPTFLDLYNEQLSKTLGEKFKPYPIKKDG